MYTFEDWAQHRSTHRYLRHVLKMPASRVVRSLMGPTCAIAGLAVLLGIYESLLGMEALPGSIFRKTPDTSE